MHWMIVDSLVRIIHGQNLREFIKQDIIARSFPRLETDCMVFYIIPELKNSLNDIIIYSWVDLEVFQGKGLNVNITV